MAKYIEEKELREWVQNWFEKNRYYHPYSKSNDIPIPELYDILERMPTADVPERNVGKWTPVSEGLPESQTEVIVSCTDDSGDTKFRYTSSGWLTTDKEYWIVDNEINNFVVAWREMPEPYREDKNDAKIY